MQIHYQHRTASKDDQAVHIEKMVGSMRTLRHDVRVAAPTLGAPAVQQGALSTITGLDLTWLGNARRVVTLAESVRGWYSPRINALKSHLI